MVIQFFLVCPIGFLIHLDRLVRDDCMTSTADSLSTTLGVIVGISLIGWLVYHHYMDTREERFPIELEHRLAILQQQLPIELDNGLVLSRFHLKRSSVDFVFQTNHKLELHLPKDEIVNKANFSLCKFRDQFLGNSPFTFRFKLLGPEGQVLSTIVNTQKVCSDLPLTLPNQYEF